MPSMDRVDRVDRVNRVKSLNRARPSAARPPGSGKRTPRPEGGNVRGREKGSAIRRFLRALGAADRSPYRRGSTHRRGRPTPLPSASLPSVERVHFLECRGLGTFSLSKERSFQVGRSQGSDLVLPLTSVSRHHAAVEWCGDAYHCHDLLSRNGTMVNGKRVPCWRLRAGDEIRIGGVPISFGETIRLQGDTDDPWSSACLVRERGVPTAARRVTLRGDLDKVRLQEIIPFLELHRRDGVLEVQGAGAGRIYFSGGEIIQARAGEVSGTDAFFQLLGQEKGTFLFREGRARARRTIRAPATALILEALRRIDEKSQVPNQPMERLHPPGRG